jgi:hypothetical protein
MAPASHIWSATIQILASSTLTKVVNILPEESMAINGPLNGAMIDASSAHNIPTISCIMAPIPEEHTRMSAMFEHLKPHKTPSSAHVLVCLAVAPAMQAIIVDRVPIVNPQLASIIGDNAVSVMASPENSHAGSPSHRKVVTTAKARPIASRVPVIDNMTPTSHVWPAAPQVRAPTSLAEVESILHEEPMAISGAMASNPPAAGKNDVPTIPSIWASVPE